jgi:hypothetical protein
VHGLAFSAARRYEPYAVTCVARLRLAFESSERRPLAALDRRAALPEWFVPIGWIGPAFASTLCANASTLRTMGAWALKGPSLSRAFEPLCSVQTFSCELLRRLALWAPLDVRRTITSADIAAFLPTLALASSRDKLAWLRIMQNAWTTRGRFSHAYNTCLICSGQSDRLVHLIVCRAFWRPVFTILGVGGGRCTLRGLLLSDFSARLVGVGFRAHAALRGRPSASAAAWAEQVRAAAK